MNHLREALSDSADHPQFIETLPRKGYRFIAPVTRMRRSPSRRPMAASPARSRRRAWLGISAAFVAAIGVAIAADIGGVAAGSAAGGRRCRASRPLP